MDRRTLLTAIFAVIGSSVTGCLETRNPMDDPRGPGGADDPTDTVTNGPSDGDDPEDGDTNDDGLSDNDEDRNPNTDADGVRVTRFEVLGFELDYEVSASVTFKNDVVTITGTIMGNNSCYTARVGEVAIENRTLFVNVESYEDADEGEACLEADHGFEYEAVIEFDRASPTSVTVKHNGEKVTTAQNP